jgi:glycosyltransferase involved in cell wall biosynthesis
VLTIHDLAYLIHPETHIARRVRRARRRLPLMTRTADMIITPTESVRGEVCERLGVNPSKVVAVPEAPRRIFSPLAAHQTIETRRRLLDGHEDAFLLAVGTIEPRKNLTTLLRAFEEWTQQNSSPQPTLRLVLVGDKGWLTDEFFASVAASRVRELIHFTGYISDADLRALYSSCTAFIYPSIYEGFGLPVLEAMACGAPVVASRIASIAETAGQHAARLFAPDDAHALARLIHELVNDVETRTRLSRDGQQHAARFTWERAARLTLDVYKEAKQRRAKAALA